MPGAAPAWTCEEKLDLVVGLLLKYSPSPNVKDVKLPAGRTEEAAKHALRAMRKNYEENHPDSSGVASPAKRKASGGTLTKKLSKSPKLDKPKEDQNDGDSGHGGAGTTQSWYGMDGEK